MRLQETDCGRNQPRTQAGSSRSTRRDALRIQSFDDSAKSLKIVMASSKHFAARLRHREKHHKLIASLIYRDASPPTIIRIIEKFGPSSRTDNNVAADVLRSALHCVRRAKFRSRSQFLMTCGGFLRCVWPRGLVVSNPSKPSSRDLDTLRAAARRAGNTFLQEFLPQLRKITRCIALGIDCSNGLNRSAEFVYIRDLHDGRVWVTGKSYPTIGQEGEIVCFPMKSHLLEVESKEILVLGCHDLNLFSNRALTATKVGSPRHRRIKDMRRTIRTGKATETVLHHPHWTDSANIWKTALSGLEKIVKPKVFASSGRWWRNGLRRRMKLNICLARTGSNDVASVIIREA
jgi:hypothetical protein